MITQDLFDKYIDDQDLLIDLLQASRLQIFDYLMNMVGEKLFCLQVIDEVYQAILSSGKSYTSPNEFSVSVFKTARNFSIDRFEETLELKRDELGLEQIKAFEYLSSLPAASREVLVLKLRYGFDKVSVCELTGFSLDQLESVYANTIDAGFDEIISELPLFVMPAKAEESHVAVSEIALDIKKQSRSRRSWRYVALIAIIILIYWDEIMLFLKHQF